ncbi:9833_t:CDS:2 [Cetraspora pellucida]|uniref:9833_t:CDS:1 n=1 Tax=Cetraspora pellucida TaxID=1433469 RepID=A0A9N9NSQ5_9GLOM|nr:9833_t:CDS:2 [Cetraspora pellucida]
MSFSQVTNPAHTEHETTDNTIEENNTNSTTETVTTTDQALDQESKSVTESLKADQASDWQAIWDDNVQAYYYWNTVTNETTWQIPNSISYTEGSYYQCPSNDSTISADQAASATTATEEYYQYYYAQYGYYPEGYYYGYDTTSTAVTAPSEPPNPLESILDKIDTEVKSKLDGSSSSLPSSSSISQHNESNEQSNEQPQEQEQESSTSDASAYYQYSQTAEDSDYNSFLAQHGNEGTDYTISARFNTRTGKFQRDPTLTPEKFSSDAKAIRQMSYFFDYESFAEQRSKRKGY